MFWCTFLLPQWHQSLCVMKLVVSFPKKTEKRKSHFYIFYVGTQWKFVDLYVLYVAFRLTAENPLLRRRGKTLFH